MASATAAAARAAPASRMNGAVAHSPAIRPCVAGWRVRCLHGLAGSETGRAPAAVQAARAQLRAHTTAAAPPSQGLGPTRAVEKVGMMRAGPGGWSRLVMRSSKPNKESSSSGKGDDQVEAPPRSPKKEPRPQPDGPEDNQNPLSRLLATVWSRVAALGGGALGLVRSRGVAAFLTFGALLGAMAAAATLGNSHRASQAAKAPKEVLYSEFLTMVQSKGVQNAVIDDSGNRVYFSLRPHSSEVVAPVKSADGAVTMPVTSSPAELRKEAYQFYTQPVKNAAVASELMSAGVDFGAMKSSIGSAISKVLVTMLIVWIPMLPLIIMLRRTMDSRSGSGGRKRSKKAGGPGAPSITFADVAGVDTAKDELMEVVSCLKDNTRYAKLNAKMPSGVLLSGPPGTGKTLLAKAVAGEAGVPFFAASASEFVELFVGRGAARVRELFAEARKRSPCVVFIDELDAVGMKRGFGNNEERDQTLNQLLTELDGFEGREGVLLLAATNRPESLDPALLRPGRLSRKVVVPLPDEVGRANILAIHMKDVPFDETVDKNDAIMRTARIAGGFSGAELANVVNEAAMLAARKGAEVVTLRELIEGVSRTRYGVDGRRPQEGSLNARIRDWFLDNAAAQNKAATPSGPGQQLTG